MYIQLQRGLYPFKIIYNLSKTSPFISHEKLHICDNLFWCYFSTHKIYKNEFLTEVSGITVYQNKIDFYLQYLQWQKIKDDVWLPMRHWLFTKKSNDFEIMLKWSIKNFFLYMQNKNGKNAKNIFETYYKKLPFKFQSISGRLNTK